MVGCMTRSEGSLKDPTGNPPYSVQPCSSVQSNKSDSTRRRVVPSSQADLADKSVCCRSSRRGPVARKPVPRLAAVPKPELVNRAAFAMPVHFHMPNIPRSGKPTVMVALSKRTKIQLSHRADLAPPATPVSRAKRDVPHRARWQWRGWCHRLTSRQVASERPKKRAWLRRKRLHASQLRRPEARW